MTYINIDDFPRTADEIDDTGRIRRAINYAAAYGHVLWMGNSPAAGSCQFTSPKVYVDQYDRAARFRRGCG
jgi:hypothetical protein